MWKPILAGTVALALVGGSLSYAQNRPGRDGSPQWRPSVEDMRAFGEARLAGLKAGLVLNPEQEKNWPAFEQAARDLTRLRIERRTAATDSAATPRPTDPAEWMQRRAAAMTETGGVLKKLGDATGPLYNSLDDAQKRRFAILSRLGSGGQAFRDRGGRQWQRGGMRRTDNEGQDQMAPERRLMSPVRGEERL